MLRSRVLLGVATAVLMAGCGGGNDPDDQPVPTPSSTDVTIVADASTKGSSAYSPNPFTVTLASGGVVDWFNNDQGSPGNYGGSNAVTHTVTADDGSFDSGNINGGSSYSRTFTAAGTYNYHCSNHPSMVGTITVTQ